jgi:pyruvate kinase
MRDMNRKTDAPFVRTKIVCTIGPATKSVNTLNALIREGMDAARLNFSHGTHDDHVKMYNNIRKSAAKAGVFIPIIQDLQGPKIRVGALSEPSINLIRGKTLRITTENLKGTSDVLPTTYKNITRDVKKGSIILLDDGKIRLKVLAVKKDELVCKIIDGGIIKPQKGINLPGTHVSASSLTSKDKKDLALGISLGMDFIALSFVRSPDDIKLLRKTMQKMGKVLPIIAKIERGEAVDSIEEIIREADAIMVARGDLGVELPSEDVPLIQKMIINKCNRFGIPVITATQMLESMINNSTPTRAETSDIANAVLDGTDAVMLSGETSIGKYPLLAVKTMNNVLKKTEAALPILHKEIKELLHEAPAEAIGRAACVLAEQINARAIVPVTHGGTTARILAKYRPKAIILAATANKETAHRLNLVWGVQPLYIDRLTDTDTTLDRVVQEVKHSGRVPKGSYVVFTAGMPMKIMGKTNMLKVSKL